MSLDKYQSIITKYNMDTNGNPIAVVKIDSQKIHPTKLMIQTGILDESYRVIVINKEMREVFDIENITSGSEFFVDYNNGRIFFHESMGGVTIQCKYAELGVDIINANRVASDFDEKGNIKEVLSELLENINNAVVSNGIIKENYMTNVPAASLILNPTTELYEYTLNHKLNTSKIQIQVYNGSTPLLNLCRKLDSNNIIVANDEKIDLNVVINYGSVN